jgi:hypothetical protein
LKKFVIVKAVLINLFDILPNTGIYRKLSSQVSGRISGIRQNQYPVHPYFKVALPKAWYLAMRLAVKRSHKNGTDCNIHEVLETRGYT